MEIILVLFGLIVVMVAYYILILVIKNAIDTSNTSKKLDVLIDEMRLLRKEIRENKHIIDKKV
ncbi:hypothetical protein [Cohnella mopanensis]|uniref:hypothetical protein n=1 Tax=Cohnella mopanensis TaxID=2911966 RepID=UPI001EF9497C|nr:hypothetical protein [Cohnella mopanensis]